MPPPETPVEYYQRKLNDMKEIIEVAFTHTNIITGIQIVDGIVQLAHGQAIPMISIKLDLNESLFREIKKST